ncbi:MAG: hypothetical protein K2N35_07310 [Muribaculaceae bacterium]|nr:hypothetical protein [Muribaculaceae bacterium]
MDYIMIERTLFDALVRGVRECRTALVKRRCQPWVDNVVAGLTSTQHN